MGDFGRQLKNTRITLLSVILGAALCLPANAKSTLLDKKEDGTYFVNLEVRFPPGAKRFHPRFKRELKKLADLLKKTTDISKVNIVGHTDNKGNQAVNLRLSKVRANYVRDYLIRSGFPKERLEIVAKAGGEPRYPNDKLWGQRKNRRVEFEIPIPVGESPPEVEEPPKEIPATEEEAPEENQPLESEEPAPEAEAKPESELEPEPEPESEFPDELPPPVVDEAEVDPTLGEMTEPEIQDTGPSYLDEPTVGVDRRAWWEDYISKETLKEYAPLAGLTATGLFMGTGTTLGVVAKVKEDSMDPRYFGNNDWQTARDSSNNYAIAADVFFTLSAMSAVGTAWLFYEFHWKPSSGGPSPKLEVIPTPEGVFFKLEIPFDLGGEPQK